MDPHLDVYDTSSNAQDVQAGYQALNEEVAQITTSLGRLWGGFRKQALSTVESARKIDLASVASKAQSDLASVATKAQSELRDLQEALSYPVAAPPADGTSQSVPGPSNTSESAEITEKSTETTEPKDEPAASADDSTTPTQSPSLQPASPTQTFFSRLQASFPPNLVSAVQNTLPELKNAQANLVSTVQANLPEQLKHAPSNIDLTQIRSNLTSEFQRVQGLTRAQAEEYVQKTDVLLREAYQGANEFFKDAVKVVPPEGAAATNASTGLSLDGSDLWMMDLALGSGFSGSADTGKGKDKEVVWSSPQEAQKAVATRAQALLRKLKHDPEVLKANPADEPELKVVYATWVEKEITSKQDGIKSEEWTKRIVEALQDDADGDALNSTMDELVPDVITKTEFWTRYFFRVHQVQREEERRRALLQTTVEKEDEDFSWEDDEDEEKTVAPKKPTSATAEATPSTPAPAASTAKAPSSAPPTVAASPKEPTSATSPRHSSEGSYDVVSSNVSVSGEPEKDKKTAEDEEESDDDDDDSDSDWE